MNLKERGVTVGDLLIISVIVISTIFIIGKVKEDDKKAHSYQNFKAIPVTINL